MSLQSKARRLISTGILALAATTGCTRTNQAPSLEPKALTQTQNQQTPLPASPTQTEHFQKIACNGTSETASREFTIFTPAEIHRLTSHKINLTLAAQYRPLINTNTADPERKNCQDMTDPDRIQGQMTAPTNIHKIIELVHNQISAAEANKFPNFDTQSIAIFLQEKIKTETIEKWTKFLQSEKREFEIELIRSGITIEEFKTYPSSIETSEIIKLYKNNIKPEIATAYINTNRVYSLFPGSEITDLVNAKISPQDLKQYPEATTCNEILALKKLGLNIQQIKAYPKGISAANIIQFKKHQIPLSFIRTYIAQNYADNFPEGRLTGTGLPYPKIITLYQTGSTERKHINEFYKFTSPKTKISEIFKTLGLAHTASDQLKLIQKLEKAGFTIFSQNSPFTGTKTQNQELKIFLTRYRAQLRQPQLTNTSQ